MPSDDGQDRPLTKTQRVLLAVLGTSLGMGFIPGPRGTWGTLPEVAVFLAVAVWARDQAFWILPACLIASSALTVITGNWAERQWGKKDPGRLTLDEFAGFTLTVVGFWPSVAMPWASALWGFIFTRMFDIAKPFPARRLELLPGGWGILLDDLMCSVWAIGAMYLLFHLAPGLFGL